MKNRILAVIYVIFASMLVALAVVAQTSNRARTATAPGTQETNTTSKTRTEQAKKVHRRPEFSADEAYKQNCTRCHSEVPKLDSKRSNTIMRHMRVRAGLTKAEAQGILDYLGE